jgi:ribosomal protein L3
MLKGLIGKKIGMTQIFVEGQTLPVTLIEAGYAALRRFIYREDRYSAVQWAV